MNTRIMAAVAVPLALAATVVAAQWRDISRYAKIKWMAVGNGKPGIVPAAGSTSYPSSPGESVPDGTGAFDSASRGGPETSAAAKG
ncbi:MAG: hypothetical protein J2P26_11890 [Nocardiopsaceae bacterium]|nr:hypothetical protein [Nocardiopsaceae bacterium]